MKPVPARHRLGGLLLVVALLLPAVGASRPAGADEIADKQAEAERLAKELATLRQRLGALNEDYNQARVRVERIGAEIDTAKAHVAATDAEMDRTKSKLRTQAVEAYVRGGDAPALSMVMEDLLAEDSAVRTTYVKSVASVSRELIDELRATRAKLEDQQAELAASRRQAEAAEQQVADSRTEAAKAEAAQKSALDRAKGELAELVAAEEKRRAEEEARKAAAELAARRARDEAARQAAAAEAARRATTTTTTARAVAGASTTTTVRRTTTTTTPADTGPAPPPAKGADAAVAEAYRQIGKPYEWGGSGPDSFDCSGLTAWAWKAAGKTLPHSSREQYNVTSRVSMSDIQPGDLLFFGNPIHHVGIYVGNNEMIDAPETGDYVRKRAIFRSDYVGAGRVN